MKAGMIDNWTDVEDIWEFLIYNQLGAEIGDNPIIMTEISQNPKKNREKITEVTFCYFLKYLIKSLVGYFELYSRDHSRYSEFSKFLDIILNNLIIFDTP